jgi:hypothetical protein
MATRKKTKSKTKAKRKKAPVITATSRKTKTARKKRAKKTLVRRASPKKGKPKSNAAVKPTPASPPAQAVAATPISQPLGERIGVVTHYYSHPSVATLRIESGTLRVGDLIHIRGHTTDFQQIVESLEVNHAPVTEVGSNDDFGLKVTGQVREHDVVYKVRP